MTDLLRRRPFAVVVASLCVLVAACSGSGSDQAKLVDSSSTTAGEVALDPGETSRSADQRPIDWSPCHQELECATITVPIDHDDPDGGSIELALVRRPASDQDKRIG